MVLVLLPVRMVNAWLQAALMVIIKSRTPIMVKPRRCVCLLVIREMCLLILNAQLRILTSIHIRGVRQVVHAMHS